MAKQSKYHLEIEVDKLTNSIVNTISGDSFPTDVHPITKADLKTTTRKNGWLFNWSGEFKLSDRQVFKLTIRNNPEIVQGLLSISDYTNSMKECLVTCLLSLANPHGIRAIKGSLVLHPKQN